MRDQLRRHGLALSVVLCVIVRLGVLIAFPSVFAWNETGSVHGSDAYDIYARNLLATGVYGYVPGVPDATIPPLYSYLVAAVYKVAGRGYIQIALLHIFLDVLSIIMLYQIGKRLFGPRGDWIGLLAGALTALYPYLVFQNLTLIDTPLFMTLLHAFVLGAVLLRERTKLDRTTWLLAAVEGVILGLAVLTRPVIAPLALFVALWFLFRLGFVQMVSRLLPVALIGVLVVTPWLVRDARVYDSFVAVANNGGLNFWFGNSRYTIPFLRAGYHTQWATPDEPVSKNDREASAQYFDQSFRWLRANPSQIPELLWVKLLAHWSIDVYPSRNPEAGAVLVLDANGNVTSKLNPLSANDPVVAYSQPLFDQIGRTVHRFYFGGLFFLALAGLLITARRWREVSLIWFVQISLTLVYVAFIPATRYRVPADPMLFLFSAAALVTAWSAIRAALFPAILRDAANALNQVPDRQQDDDHLPDTV